MNILRKTFATLLFAAIGVFLCSEWCLAEPADIWPWQMPLEISDRNTSVSFAVDTTWHTVEGKAVGVHGKAWLTDPASPFNVQALVNFPVAALDTDNSMRDDRMYEILESETHPVIALRIDGFKASCSPQEAKTAPACPIELNASLTIKGVTKRITLPASIVHSESTYGIQGEVTFNWQEFQIEDPSILIAKVEPMVAVTYRVQLTPSAINE